MNVKSNEITYKQELARKSIHLVSLLIPILYVFVSRETAIYILTPLTIAAIILDFLSRKKTPVQKYIFALFGKILRSHETQDKIVLNGASWVLISALLCVIVFPKIIFITAFSILITSDIAAALYGRKFGRHPLMGKSLEGFMAFIITAIMTVCFIGIMNSVPWTFYCFGIIASVVGAIAELSSKKLKMDDNLTIPISVGIILWIGNIPSEIWNAAYINLLQL